MPPTRGAKQVVVLAENHTTAMTGFQPHPGSGVDLHGKSGLQGGYRQAG